MAEPAITVLPLAPSRRDDYLRFFDHDRGPAFADNPEWARCYCHYYHVPKELAWGEFTAAQNRTAIASRIDVGEHEGYLGYAGDQVVGWLNVQPYSKLPHACARLDIGRPALPVPDFQAAAILCFVIAPPWRRRGVARALLTGALASLVERGFALVDAFPFNAGGSTAPTDHYHGPRALFEAAGFAVLRDEQDLTVMRLELIAPML
jgi:ribosomal protein S18 acetylase RimI-like enzyme